MPDQQDWTPLLVQQFEAIADDVDEVADGSDEDHTTAELREIATEVREVGASWAGTSDANGGDSHE